MPFPGALARNETQTTSSRIWTQITNFIFDDDNVSTWMSSEITIRFSTVNKYNKNDNPATQKAREWNEISSIVPHLCQKKSPDRLLGHFWYKVILMWEPHKDRDFCLAVTKRKRKKKEKFVLLPRCEKFSSDIYPYLPPGRIWHKGF